MNKHVAASVLIGAMIAWISVLVYGVPAWMGYWYRLSDGAYWGLIAAFSPLLIAVYALFVWASSK